MLTYVLCACVLPSNGFQMNQLLQHHRDCQLINVFIEIELEESPIQKRLSNRYLMWWAERDQLERMNDIDENALKKWIEKH